MFASLSSATINGVSGQPIRVEVHTSSGFPGYTVVGMPDAAMRESKERIRAALLSSGRKWPQSRITVNLAPANVRKSGTASEFAILVAMLCSTRDLDPRRFRDAGVIGELGLDGTIRSVSGTIARVLALRESGIEDVFVPAENAAEASLVSDVNIFAVENVSGLIACVTEGEPWPDIIATTFTPRESHFLDYQDVSGQPAGCEAMMVIAAGGHHGLLMGSPGIGKTMLADRLPSILPPLDSHESQEITAIASVTDGSVTQLVSQRPFRSPHHSISVAGMVGGGSAVAIPGEVTRAHHGILFLDELAEFNVRTLEALRQPLESGTSSIVRANFSTSLPAQLTLLACSNPCPCAKPTDKCICSDVSRERYLRRLSGPLIDRFDIRLELFRSPYIDNSTHSSAEMKSKVLSARKIMIERSGKVNSRLSSNELADVCPLNKSTDRYFRSLVEKREVSGRGATAIWRVARTLADLDEENDIDDIHIMRASEMREEIH
jgi:magnesium chelatase family protein